MRLISHNGFQRKLSETNWQKMIKMFDASRATRNIFGYYIVRAHSICADNDYKCLRCPLGDRQKHTNSCLQIIKHIVGEKAMECLHLNDYGILWHPKDDALARQALNQVTDVLAAAQKV